MALLPNKVYWCSQSEDDSEEGLYVGNIVPARIVYLQVLLLAVLGRLPVSPVPKALPGPPLANHLLDLSCGRPSLGALYASPPGKAIPLSVTWHQVTRHTPSNARHFLGPRHCCHSAHPPILYLQVPMVTS
ncbi:uncharacterized protein LOC144158846 isoform X3 [Haemaphysalis longicornis]